MENANSDEDKRLKALEQYHILDTGYEQAFDNITTLAGLICKTPVSLISIIAKDRQWFKSAIGLKLKEISRHISFCEYTLACDDILEIPDASLDVRFQDNPLVQHEPHLRFYAGAPLIDKEGNHLGSICVLDKLPKLLTAEQKTSLAALAGVIMALLEARKNQYIYHEDLNFQIVKRTKELEQSLSIIQASFTSTNDGILIVNLDRVRQSYNEAYLKMWDLPLNVIADDNQQVTIQYCINLVKDSNEFLDKINFYYANPTAEGQDEIKFINGKSYLRITQPQTLNGKIIGRIWRFTDITNRLELEKNISFLTTHDSLTKLANRDFFIEKINLTIRLKRNFARKLGVINFEITDLNLINLRLGYEAGNQVLLQIAIRLKTELAKNHLIGRVGGNDFGVLAVYETDHELLVLVNHIIEIISKDYLYNNEKLQIKFRLGISVSPDDESDGTVLLAFAHLAMRSAKISYKASYNFYSVELNDFVSAKVQFENDLSQAIQNKEIYLVYQPLINLKTNSIIGVEALSRWKNSSGKMIPPIEFISVAEESNLIILLGNWVIEQACLQIKLWQEQNIKVVPIAINISNKQFIQEDFEEYLFKTLSKYKVDPIYIQLELTESILLENIKLMSEKINRIANLGILFSLDDFGTGYSSLHYLAQIKFSKLKIDQSFLRGISSNLVNQAIIQTIITLGKKLGIITIAEGVETNDQVELLKIEGCNQGQGYLFSHPLTVSEYERFIKVKHDL